MQAESAHKHTHTPTTQPGVAGRSRNLSPSTHTQNANPGQEWQGTSGARTQTGTDADCPARSGGAQRKPEPKHVHPAAHQGQEWRGTSGARTQPHTPQNPVQEWRSANQSPGPTVHTTNPSQKLWGDAKARTRTPAPNTAAKIGWVTAKPRPKHKRHTTEGNPVSIAPALRQPVPCR